MIGSFIHERTARGANQRNESICGLDWEEIENISWNMNHRDSKTSNLSNDCCNLLKVDNLKVWENMDYSNTNKCFIQSHQ